MEISITAGNSRKWDAKEAIGNDQESGNNWRVTRYSWHAQAQIRQTTGLSLETWNVVCTRLMIEESLKRTAVGLMTLRIVNSPTNRGASFRESPRRGMSLVESHTRWLTRYVGAGMRFQSALTRLTLQVHLHLCTKAWNEGTPTSSWLGNSLMGVKMLGSL